MICFVTHLMHTIYALEVSITKKQSVHNCVNDLQISSKANPTVYCTLSIKFKYLILLFAIKQTNICAL